MPKDLTPQKIVNMVLRHIKLIVLVTILITLITFGYSKFFIAPTYSASSLILVQNYDQDNTQPTTSISNKVPVGDISASATLAGNCVILFTNAPEMTSLMTCPVTIQTVDESNFVKIIATDSNAQNAANVANQLADQARICYSSFYEYGKVSTIKTASPPSAPYAPNIAQNTIYGFAIGLILGVLLAFFLEIIDTTIKPGDDLAKLYSLPVFAEIVDFEQEG